MKFLRSKDEDESYLEKRERIQLTETVLKELKRQESLKKTLLDELGNRNSIYKLFQHPAVLLVLGSLLTGLLGTYLSILWQSKEWDRQQDLLAKQRFIEQKYQVANDTAKALGEMRAGMVSVLRAMQIDNDSVCILELQRVMPEWKKEKNEWDVKTSILLLQLMENFPAQTEGSLPPTNIASQFQGIGKCYHKANVALANMTEAIVEHNGKRDDSIEKDGRVLAENLNGAMNTKMTGDLMRLFAEQLRFVPEVNPSPSGTSVSPQSRAVPNDPCSVEVHVYSY